jgi:hypothetical protein
LTVREKHGASIKNLFAIDDERGKRVSPKENTCK